jgi:hypothetical protein
MGRLMTSARSARAGSARLHLRGWGRHRGWLLSGLVKCGQCGSPMTIVSRKHGPDEKHYANVGCKTYDATGGTCTF